jgi:protein-S-isoprenylcysteine O-methyltransferase Ste14
MTMTDTPNDNPGVRFPPPLVYLAAIIGGYLLQRFAPLAIGDGRVRVAAAWIFVGLWAVITIAAFHAFWSRRTSIVPVRPATTLVAAGPYRFTRNPMYVGLASLTVGAGLSMNTWWVILLLVPALILIDRFVIAREEAYLRRRFGAGYDEYMRRVRRWV